MEFSLAWPSISKSFGATGRFVWHDEPVDASITLSDLPPPSPAPVRVQAAARGAPIKIAFDGSLSSKPTLRIQGTLPPMPTRCVKR